jgi:hypothetical protein
MEPGKEVARHSWRRPRHRPPSRRRLVPLGDRLMWQRPAALFPGIALALLAGRDRSPPGEERGHAWIFGLLTTGRSWPYGACHRHFDGFLDDCRLREASGTSSSVRHRRLPSGRRRRHPRHWRPQRRPPPCLRRRPRQRRRTTTPSLRLSRTTTTPSRESTWSCTSSNARASPSPGSRGAGEVPVGCSLHLDAPPKDAERHPTRAGGSPYWHLSDPTLVRGRAHDTFTPSWLVLRAGGFSVYCHVDGVRSNEITVIFR